MTGLPPEADIELILDKWSAYDPFQPVVTPRNQMSQTNLRWLHAGVFAIALATSASANPYAGTNDNPSARLQFAMDPFNKPISHSYSLGNAKERVLRRFGDPIEESVSTHETRFPGEYQTTYGLAYIDIQFVIGKGNDRPNTWIQQIEITGNTHDLKFGVRIGTARAEIISLFAPVEHQASSNPMLVSVPTLETQSSFDETMGKIVSYTPSFHIKFEFDDSEHLSKLSISVATDE